MTKIKDFLLGCLARPLVAGFLVYLPISYSNYEPPQDLDLLVGIIGALIGGMLGAFFGQRSIPKNLEHQLKSMLIGIFYGLLITYIFPKALCVFYFEKMLYCKPNKKILTCKQKSYEIFKAVIYICLLQIYT